MTTVGLVKIPKNQLAASTSHHFWSLTKVLSLHGKHSMNMVQNTSFWNDMYNDESTVIIVLPTNPVKSKTDVQRHKYSQYDSMLLFCLRVHGSDLLSAAMSPHAWIFCALLCVLTCERSKSAYKGPVLSRKRRLVEDEADGAPRKCSYTFLVPEQKITGPICASQGPSLPDKERVTQSDIADVRKLLTKQRREMDTLRMIVDVDGNMVNEIKLLRKESRNMNSRVTQLYMQLLHEIIRKRDNSLELAQLEGRILNSTAEALRLSALYRELEVRFSALAALVNNQSLLIAALEERCLQVYGNHRREPLPPPLMQVVPENIPVYVPRFSNEIQKSQGWPVPEDRSSRRAPAPTGGSPQGNVSIEGNEAITQQNTQHLCLPSITLVISISVITLHWKSTLICTPNTSHLNNKSHLSNIIILKYQRLLYRTAFLGP